MTKTSVTIKAAWITAVATLLSVILSGALNHFSKKEKIQEDLLTSLLLNIPANSTITITISQAGDKNSSEIEASIRKKILNRSSLKIIERSKLSQILNELRLVIPKLDNRHQLFQLARLNGVDYIIEVDQLDNVWNVVEVESGIIIASLKI